MFFIIIFQSSIPSFPLGIEKGRERTALVGGCFAVLRYKIAKQTLEAEDGVVLSDQSLEDVQRWRDIVRFYRSGKKVGDTEPAKFLEKARFGEHSSGQRD